MDGSPSAPDSDREFSERVGKRSRESDADRELNDLRARAYGPDPDIEADPAALARLIVLEAAHVAVSAAVPGAEPRVAATAVASRTGATAGARVAVAQATPTAESTNETRPGTSSGRSMRPFRRHVTAPSSRVWFIVGQIAVVVLIMIFSLTWLFGPRADATLHVTEGETNGEVLDVLDYQGLSTDASTLRQFEPFHDVDVWSVENGLGYLCLAAWDRGSGRFETQCVPPGTELAIYVVVPAEAEGGFGHSLPEGSFVSLHLRANTVNVYVHDPPTAG